MAPARRPLLVFDGQCGFCRAWVERWQVAIRDHVDVAASQDVASSLPAIPAGRFAESVVLVEPDGSASYGAHAVFRALAHAPGRGLGLWAYRHVPGFAGASEGLYRIVARNRGAATAITRVLWGAHVAPPGERLTAWIVVRLVALAYAVAFVSLAAQVRGLIGRDGILPASEYLAQVAAHYGPERFYLLPTLAWLGSGDGALLAICAGGLLAALLAMVGAAPRASLLAAWAAYLSISTVGGEFLWFQWDSLLLESGIVAVLLSPWALWSGPRDPRPPSRAAVWLGRWLLFRLVFSSAVVKWSSGDPAWRQLTALRFHYETQPLPPWAAWYAHHLPAGFQAFSALVMFAIEGVVPLLVFAPRRLRMFAAAAIAFLQALIVLTGNYGFFNWLTLALCLLLLDDAAWPRWLRDRLAPRRTVARDAMPGSRATALVAIALAVLGLVPLAGAFRTPAPWLAPVAAADAVLEPFRSVNSYGLFAVMTTRRLEITLEGSDDGQNWRPYAFRWKPGDPLARPAFVPGHMPRLDWQMWFAALAPGRPAYWFVRFARQLLAGSRPVRALLATNPFPDAPPRELRARLELYHFSDAATRRASGAWWTREPAGVYLPPVALSRGELVLVSDSTATR
jgi:predicted DCC family thiol-disulfide oxidoreductase YuxK